MIKLIVPYPNEWLRTKSTEVPPEDFDSDLEAFCVDMLDTMHAANAAGLAAVQIGTAARILCISKEVAGSDEDVIMINPHITGLSYDKQIMREGCLSFLDEVVMTARSKWAKVKYLDVKGIEHEVLAHDVYAQAVQHEVEHLDGILLYDHAKIAQKDKIREKFKQYKNVHVDYNCLVQDRPKEMAEAITQNAHLQNT